MKRHRTGAVAAHVNKRVHETLLHVDNVEELQRLLQFLFVKQTCGGGGDA